MSTQRLKNRPNGKSAKSGQAAADAATPERANGHAPLDPLDTRIVGFLTDDPRMSARAIAKRIGVSPGTVSQRIGRLAQRSVISGYRTMLNAEALGYEVHAILGLQLDQGPTLDDAVAELLKIPEVESVQIVTGQWDVLAELRLRDHPHLLDVLRTAIYRIPGFRRVETMISLATRSRPGGWRPPELLEDATRDRA